MPVMHVRSIRAAVAATLVVVLIVALRFKPWRAVAPSSGATGPDGGDGREHLTVGFLPVTCHLTCPVTDFASRTSKRTRFDSQRFTDFPSVVETLKSGRLEATFMILPLAMKLRSQGLPVKVVYLGHRDGSTVIVKKADAARSLADLRGKTFAIPSRYSNQNIVIHKLMEQEGLADSAMKFVELPPPDMPTALAAGAIDAYFVGEPHAAKAELDGTGRVLYHVKDVWPNFISCGLVVMEKLIQERPDVVRDLVRGIAQSGRWAQDHREEAAKVASRYFRQSETLVRYVLTTPPDRVRYDDLTPTVEELEKMQAMALKLGIFTTPIKMTDLLDDRFVDTAPAQIELDTKPITDSWSPN
jgi:NitT/TauT family transport system substrate-binding protein